MKIVILAGGLGTRISEETLLRPKPMINIGGKPILWHIMKTYSHFGFKEFVICCGYKSYVIKEYFSKYFLHTADVTIDMASGKVDVHQANSEDWRVTLVETGLNTMTGGRLQRIRRFIDGPFCMTYGDGVTDLDIGALVRFHQAQGRQATVTAIRPAARFGSIEIDGTRASAFLEKPKGDGRWVSGGFFVLEPSTLDLIDGDDTIWEREPLETLTDRGQLSVYKHDGFWGAMDTQRDRTALERMWSEGKAPWRVWD